jgi:hypothetical protein
VATPKSRPEAQAKKNHQLLEMREDFSKERRISSIIILATSLANRLSNTVGLLSTSLCELVLAFFHTCNATIALPTTSLLEGDEDSTALAPIIAFIISVISITPLANRLSNTVGLLSTSLCELVFAFFNTCVATVALPATSLLEGDQSSTTLATIIALLLLDETFRLNIIVIVIFSTSPADRLSNTVGLLSARLFKLRLALFHTCIATIALPATSFLEGNQDSTALAPIIDFITPIGIITTSLANRLSNTVGLLSTSLCELVLAFFHACVATVALPATSLLEGDQGSTTLATTVDFIILISIITTSLANRLSNTVGLLSASLCELVFAFFHTCVATVALPATSLLEDSHDSTTLAPIIFFPLFDGTSTRWICFHAKAFDSNMECESKQTKRGIAESCHSYKQ